MPCRRARWPAGGGAISTTPVLLSPYGFFARWPLPEQNGPAPSTPHRALPSSGCPVQSMCRMKIVRPRFTLKETCPVCEQGSSLVFLTCPHCSAIVLACEEEGSVFPEPCDLSKQADWPSDSWRSTTIRCPHCLVVGEFRLLDR